MKTILAVLVAMSMSSVAFADEKACAGDIEKFCPGVKPGHGAIMKCLHAHKDELSAECKAKGEKMREVMKEHREELKEACADDVAKLCGDIKGGKGAKMKCMREKKDQASAACKTELETTKKDLKEAMKK